MTLELQFKLKNNPMYLNYLHQSSNWYKILNRQPERFNEFIEEMKTNYRIRPQDKVDKFIDTLDLLNTIMSLK